MAQRCKGLTVLVYFYSRCRYINTVAPFVHLYDNKTGCLGWRTSEIGITLQEENSKRKLVFWNIYLIYSVWYILFPYVDGRLFKEFNIRQWTANSGSKDVCWQMPAVDVVISDLIVYLWRGEATPLLWRGYEGIKSIVMSAEKLYWHSARRWTRSVKFGRGGHLSWIFQANLFHLMILLCFSWGIWFMLCEQ